ncbi:hypothetical protein NSA23_00660 [Anaerosalibacter massiliensis]|uniref:Uncharacterized protein n=1 Tax=Anaerosalibacter massiliensis TaxID=1347392 RepID=A0A9X2S3E1_9FIRM|nr:hypothetical protein [Anaerosalibacter massiliensis]MCR2042615.1 hypothetical protein [Anaerosalibacter massiliensis]
MLKIKSYMKNEKPHWILETDDAVIKVALEEKLKEMIERNERIIKSKLETDIEYKRKLAEEVKRYKEYLIELSK